MEKTEIETNETPTPAPIYGDVTNPKWANADHTMINMDVFFFPLNETVPFTASPNDPEPHGRELFERAVAGEFGPIADHD